ncbi:MAG: hypothetical protein NC350_01325 [Corallococcus sp.]|nr:hypothetical protein [Corallococcus sp.]
MKFDNQEIRREKYGSAFLELAYCKIDNKVSVKKILKLKNLPRWQNDSLYVYVDDLDDFYNEYHKAFDIISDDLFGVKYFSTDDIGKIIEILNTEKPTEFQDLVSWLNLAINYNGFYILGI